MKVGRDEDLLDGAPDGAAVASAPDLSGRVAALKDRAAGLRGPVVPGGERARMGRGIDTGALR